jgi:hypothetical protein
VRWRRREPLARALHVRLRLDPLRCTAGGDGGGGGAREGRGGQRGGGRYSPSLQELPAAGGEIQTLLILSDPHFVDRVAPPPPPTRHGAALLPCSAAASPTPAPRGSSHPRHRPPRPQPRRRLLQPSGACCRVGPSAIEEMHRRREGMQFWLASLLCCKMHPLLPFAVGGCFLRHSSSSRGKNGFTYHC